MHTPQTRESAKKMSFFFLRALHDEILKVSISRELYVILNWLIFHSDEKTHRFITF